MPVVMVPLEGPVGVGALIDAVMLGCIIVQSGVYYKNSRGDAWLWKALLMGDTQGVIDFVGQTLLLLSHLVCMAVWLWARMQAGGGDALLPGYATVLFGVSTILATTISFLERCFFSHRILKMSNNNSLGFVFFICCIFSFTAALGAACTFFTNATADLTSQISSSWVFPLVIIMGLVCDLAISIVTAFCIRSQTPAESADTLGRVARLLFLIAETSAVTSLFDVALVLVYWFTKANLAWVGLFVAMPGVFANCLLAVLNVRGRLYAEIEHQRVLEIGEKLIDKRAKRPPIMISISRRTEKRSGESFV